MTTETMLLIANLWIMTGMLSRGLEKACCLVLATAWLSVVVFAELTK